MLEVTWRSDCVVSAAPQSLPPSTVYSLQSSRSRRQQLIGMIKLSDLQDFFVFLSGLVPMPYPSTVTCSTSTLEVTK
ncbi:hypothetical protein E2C01_044499 [Portunus trituberculatus]|uniref:Uncharacterized protein n=1 Tax=Portunus trituberculatus TaxID=210409 RepID=A0A5B7FSC2_PORTR|nr:hypothetical protein [Portunus trituberculatus]